LELFSAVVNDNNNKDFNIIIMEIVFLMVKDVIFQKVIKCKIGNCNIVNRILKVMRTTFFAKSVISKEIQSTPKSSFFGQKSKLRGLNIRTFQGEGGFRDRLFKLCSLKFLK